MEPIPNVDGTYKFKKNGEIFMTVKISRKEIVITGSTDKIIDLDQNPQGGNTKINKLIAGVGQGMRFANAVLGTGDEGKSK
jgi:hypothetical protein